jgi:hypothetical protein
VTVNFICVEGTEYGATEFVNGSGGKFVSYEEMYANITLPMCWAGFFKPLWLEISKKNNLKFYNFDSGYFGNKKKKIIFRLSVNNFQNTDPIIDRPSDRWERLNIKLESFKQGSDIVVIPPDRKKMHALNLGKSEEWVANTIEEIKKYSDRPIRIRERPEPRADRLIHNTFKDFIKENTFCVVGHSTNALVEAAMCDIPVISLGHSATHSLYNYSLSDIEKLKPVDQDQKQAWLNHLSYSQFTREELKSGYAWEIINHLPPNLSA